VVGAILASVVGCATEPDRGPAVAPGTYVLTSLDNAPPPFLRWRQEEVDSVLAGIISYDSIVVIDDSTVRESYRQAITSQHGDQAPIEIGAGGFFRVTMKMRWRGGTLVLVPPPDVVGWGPVFLTPRDGELIQRIEQIQSRCVPLKPRPCAIVSDRIVDGRYVRR
jgi:hypothetical protein